MSLASHFSKQSRYIFLLMFSLFLLLNLNYTILRSLRTTLAVVDLGSGAHSIPLFELFGAMPGALLMTWGLTHLMNRFSIEKVFLISISLFIGFFLTFNLFIYPYALILKAEGSGDFLRSFISMIFYVMSELWKPALAIILFWGLVNQYIPVEEAKSLYAPLMLGGSLGTMIAGPLISSCTSAGIWVYSFNLMVVLVSIIGLISSYLYYLLWKNLVQNPKNQTEQDVQARPPLSLKDSVQLCLENSQLRLLSWIVIADYISYSLGEVIFLEVLRMRFPNASDYCNYMGQLSLWSGILTFIGSIFIAPFILKRYHWIVAFLITPFCLLVTEGFFFIFLRGYSVGAFGWSEMQWITWAIILGSVQYCLCRAAKYTLFDSSKELAFVLMPDSQRMKGKLVVDGLCARFGRGAASLLSMGLIKVSGGVIASSFLTGWVAIGMVLSWLFSGFKLGRLVDKPVEESSS